MASSTALAFDIIARDKASNTFDKAGRASEGLGSKLVKLAKIGAAATVGLGAAAAVAGVKFAKMAIEDEASASKLARAMKNNANATRGQIAATEDWITKQGIAYGVADDDLRPALSRLVAATHDVGKAQSLASLAMNVSAGTGKSLKTVTEALSKAQLGNLGGLSRLGVATKNAEGKTRSLKAITDSLSETYKGQASKAAEATAGRFQRLRLRLSELAESIGYSVIPIADKLVGFLLDNVMPALGRVGQFAGTVGGKISTAFAKIHLGDFAKKIQGALSGIDVKGIGANLAKQAKAWAAPVIGGFKVGLNTGDWSGLGQALGNGIVRALQGLGSGLAKITKALGDMLGKVDWVGIGISMGKQAPSLLAGLAVGLLNFDIGGLLGGLADHWQDALLAILAIAFTPGKIIGKVGEILARIPLVGKLLEWGLLHLKRFADGLVGGIGKALGFMGKAFMSGFRRVFPEVGKAFAEGLRLFPTRIGLAALDIAERAGKMMRGLAGAIGKGIGAVIAKIGEVVGHIVKPFADAGSWLLDKGAAVIRGLLSGLRSAIGAVIKFFAGIGKRILSAIGDLSHLLWDAGAAIIGGLIDGIESKVGALVGKLKSITNLIPKIKGPLDKDKILLQPAGVAIMEGLINGIESRKTKLTTALEAVTGYIQKQNNKIADLVSKRDSLSSSFQGFTSSVFGTDLSNQDTGAPPTVDALLKYQQQQRDKARALQRDVSRLLKMGLSKNLIEQLAGSGESGIAQIHALAQGSKSDVAQLNALNAQTISALNATGGLAGNAVYGDSIKIAEQNKAVALEIRKQLEAWRHEQDKNTIVEIHLEGRTIQMSLLQLKRNNGGKALGLS